MKMVDLTGHLSTCFGWIARVSVQASVLVCLILAVQTILRRRLTSRWHYCLWLVLVVRLMTPWVPESSMSIFNLLPFDKGPLPVFVYEEATIPASELAVETA